MKPPLDLFTKNFFSPLPAALAALFVFLALPQAAPAQMLPQPSAIQIDNPNETQAKTPLHRMSAKTHRQIALLEAEADARTPVQRKISSQLIYTLKAARSQPLAPGIAAQRTEVVLDSAGMTLVDINAAVTPTLLAAIQTAGGQIIGSSVRFGQVRASVPLNVVEALAALPEVRQIKPAVIAQLQDAPTPKTAPGKARAGQAKHRIGARPFLPSLLSQAGVTLLNLPPAAAFAASTNAVGATIDEADKTHQADVARSAYHVDGTGIKVGVLSDSLDNGNGIYADALASGDVSSVSVISGQSGGAGSGEGLAMLECVHHLAPGAQLYFATGASGEGQFADNIIALQKAGCKVIIDDEAYPDESPFQDDIIAQAINTVTAAGVMYFSCAANYGNLISGTSSVWENDFSSSGNNDTGDGLTHQFDTSGDELNEIQTNGQTTVSLFWSDPLGKSSNDYDLFVVDPNGNIVASSTDRQTGSQDPFEYATAQDGDSIAIVKHSGSTRFLHVDLNAQHSIFNYATNDRTRGHNAAANAFCVAATPAAAGSGGDNAPDGPYPNPFNTSNKVETFSNDGPRHIFFNPDGSAITTDLTHAGGKVLNKPDFTAADGTTTTMTQAEVGDGKEALSPFFGTSCAAPHAGAIAALLLSYNLSLTRAQLSTILKNSATDIMASGYDVNSGTGILNAYKALQATPAPTSAVTLSSVSFSPSSGFGGSTNPTGTVTLTKAATAATTVTLSSSTASLVVPSSVTIAAGSTSATFSTNSHTVTAVTTATVTASSGGVSKTGTFTVNPTSVSSVSFSPTSVTGGSANSTGTVTMAGAVGSAQTITLTSSNTAALTVPASVSLPYGNTSVTFTATSHSVTSATTVTVTASYNGGSKTSTVTVNPATTTAASLASISFNPTSGFGGSTNPTGTVTLTKAATAATTVTLSSSTASLVVPSSVTIAAGSTSATFSTNSHTVTAVTTATVTASSGGVSKTGTFTVNPTSVSSVSFNPTSVTGGSANSTGTVTMAGAVGSAQTITLTSSNTAALTVPASVSLPYGNTSVTFTATSHSVTSATTVTVTASYNGGSKTSTVTVNPAASGITPKTLAFNPNPAVSNSLITGTVTLTAAAPSGGTAVTLSSVSGGTKTALLTVTVAAGSTTGTFTLRAGYVSASTAYSYSADAGGGSATASLTVSPTTVQLSSLTVTPNPVSSSGFLTATVTLSAAAPAGGAAVSFSQNGTFLGYLTVPAGSTSKSLMFFPPQVTSATAYTYSSYYNAVAKTVTVTVSP